MGKPRQFDNETAIQELREYVLDRGFKQESEWYFRISWMDRNLLNFLNERGLIKKVCGIKDAKKMGIKLPQNKGYEGNMANRSLIYKVTDAKINELESSAYN